VLLALLGFFFRTQLLAFFKHTKKNMAASAAVSLDDIPLDELEMPWHKWDKA